MKNDKHFFIPVLLIVLLFLSYSCKKTEADNETQSVVDNAACEQEFMRIGPMINAIANGNSGVKKLIAGINAVCPGISIAGDTTWTDPANPPVLTINYGTSCLGIDGRTRSGDVICSFSKPFDSTGCVITVSFNNYYSSGMKYEGLLTMTRLSQNSFSIKITNGKCNGSGWILEYSCDRTMTMIAGNSTPANEMDDAYSINGNSEGTSRTGKHFTIKTLTDLTKHSACKWIQSGKFELTPKDLAARIIDYGNGDCDNKATFTVNGNTFEFIMN